MSTGITLIQLVRILYLIETRFEVKGKGSKPVEFVLLESEVAGYRVHVPKGMQFGDIVRCADNYKSHGTVIIMERREDTKETLLYRHPITKEFLPWVRSLVYKKKGKNFILIEADDRQFTIC